MKKVMVLEDESSIRSFIVINLRRAGYEVIEAETGEEALEKLQQNHDIRVALLDIMLPGIDGFSTRMNVGIVSLMRQCTAYAVRFSHNSDHWFSPVLAKHFFD